MNRFEMIAPLGSNLKYFVKWTVISCLIGTAGGLAGTLFGLGIQTAADLFALPYSHRPQVYRGFHEEEARALLQQLRQGRE